MKLGERSEDLRVCSKCGQAKLRSAFRVRTHGVLSVRCIDCLDEQRQYATYLGDEKRCSKCGEVKSKEDFLIRSKKNGINYLTSQCRQCGNEAAKNRAKRKTDLVRKIKVEKGCVDCGFNTHPAALQFDHLGDKLFGIAAAPRSIDKILLEIEKCEVVCANCHAIRTFERRKGLGE